MPSLFGCACLTELAALSAQVSSAQVVLAQLVTSTAAIRAAQLSEATLEAKIMSALSDLQGAVAALNTSVSAEIAAATAALSNNPSAAQVEAVVTQLGALKTTIDTETATLAGTPPAAPSGAPTS